VEHLGALCYVQAGTVRETSSANLKITNRELRLSRRGGVGGSHLLVCQVTLQRNGISCSPELWIRNPTGQICARKMSHGLVGVFFLYNI